MTDEAINSGGVKILQPLVNAIKPDSLSLVMKLVQRRYTEYSDI